MSPTRPPSPPSDAALSNVPKAALARLARPISPDLTRAGALSALAELLWLAQAAAVALALGGLVVPPAALSPLAAAGVFLALAALRAALEARADARARAAADRLLAALREEILARAGRLQANARALPPAELAALLGEKLAALAPWAIRYRPAMMRAKLVPAAIFLAALSLDWVAALILLVAGPLIPLFMALVGMAAQEASERQMAGIGTLNSALMERIAAAADLRLLGAEARAGADLAASSEDLRQRSMKVLAVAFLSSTVLELFSALGVAMVAVYVGFSLLGELPALPGISPLSPAPAIFLLMVAPEFFQPLRDLAAAWHDRASALAVAGEVEAAQAGLAQEGQLLGLGAPAPPLPPAALVWSGLRLRAGPDAPELLPPDGHLAPGEAVALNGPSGAGKTTLLAALAGLVVPQAGEIRWGDLPLRDDSADAFRAGMAWLPQAPAFLNAPLEEALTLGRPGNLAMALQAARAEAVLAGLPGGLQARLGDLGGGVSGGEARRLMVARAFHSGASLVLADEPTADLDPQTAAQVIDALLALRRGGATLLVASHDPAVHAAMDRVLDLPAPPGTAPACREAPETPA